jgi:hypothetical protein
LHKFAHALSWAAFEYQLSKNDVKRPTYIDFVLMDKGYTCSLDLNPRLGKKDTENQDKM